jgi:hypothetical protein
VGECAEIVHHLEYDQGVPNAINQAGQTTLIYSIDQIRQLAIHRLSTDRMLSPIEKVLLARAHGVSAWMYEAVSSLAICNHIPTLEDLAILGWETVARILWIRNHAQYTRCFKGDAIKCMHCSSSSSLLGSKSIYRGGCGHNVIGDAELTFLGSASPILGTTDFSVSLNQIQCLMCKRTPFYSIAIKCNSCSYTYHYSDNPTVRVTRYKMKTMIEEMFGQEMKEPRA